MAAVEQTVTTDDLVLPFTDEVKARTAPLFDKVKNQIDELDWVYFAPLIDEINRLKKEKNAVILAHNYQTPEIYHCVADVVGDSLKLARDAVEAEADTIVLCGVHFMAETAKILNPAKRVLIPDPKAGCSLAESITADDVLALKAQYPGVPVVTYVNTTAEVKAVSDICCTSGNAVEVIESLGTDRVIMLPDKYLAANIAKQTGVEVITWEKGRCEVHEQFTPEQVQDFRDQNPGVVVIAHPECTPEVVDVADFSGSTAQMANYVRDHHPDKVFMVTECSMSDNVAAENPEVDFVKPCTVCPHMKRITLAKILTTLRDGVHEVDVDPALAEKARGAVDRMLAVK
ncbi:quinolinate synthase NadA [Aestuariispira ectoiniformans]|uniref:quinolinate synthase NadA n=1 Tax=Aestuariispira ectoiniformans TaxID=2775080 RepID=UPI00223ABDED|nr:quinolinate synthase NadA [Aestuariispira ectoiniformans]